MQKFENRNASGGGAKRPNHVGFSAFTLAEMMVVMLIISIVLAAMAPVMTTRNKIDNSSPWHWVTASPSDAYFGAGQAMRAFIGQTEGTDNDSAKLVINTAGSQLSHILFKSNDNILGDLYMSRNGDAGSSIVLGNRRNPAATIGNENINIGWNNWPTANLTGASNITIGDASMQSLTSGSHNIGLGTTLTSVTTGNHNIGIGDDSLTNVTGNGNIAIGGNANPNVGNVSSTIAIGRNTIASSIGAIAIGSNVEASGGGDENGAIARGGYSIAIGNGAISNYNDDVNGLSIAIGTRAKANSEDDSTNAAIAIGYGAESNSSSSIALGTGTNVTGGSAIAIGNEAQAPGDWGVAIGPYTNVTGTNGIAIGKNARAYGESSGNSIAIGNNARAQDDAIAIGRDAYIVRLNGGIAIGAGARAGATDSNMYGDYAIAIGKDAKAGSDYGVSVGYQAGNSTKGSNNTAIGVGACLYVKGSNKTCIGANSGPGSNSDWASTSDTTERIFIGSKSKFNDGPAVLEVHNGIKDLEISRSRNLAKSVVVINGALLVKGGIITSMPWVDDRKFDGNGGVNMIGRTDGQLEPVNVNWDHTESQLSGEFDIEAHGRFKSPNSGNYYSDRRLKYVGKESSAGLDKIRQLKVFNYTFKKDTTKEPHVGVIAQDLQKVFPNAVKKGADGFLKIRMEDMFYAVINAIKELDAKYQAQEKRINDLEKRVEKLEARAK